MTNWDVYVIGEGLKKTSFAHAFYCACMEMVIRIGKWLPQKGDEYYVFNEGLARHDIPQVADNDFQAGVGIYYFPTIYDRDAFYKRFTNAS